MSGSPRQAKGTRWAHETPNRERICRKEGEEFENEEITETTEVNRR